MRTYDTPEDSPRRRTPSLATVLATVLVLVQVGLTSACSWGCIDNSSKLYIQPREVRTMAPGQTQEFKVVRHLEDGDEDQYPPVTKWSASAGSIAPTGVFTAPTEPGECTITAKTEDFGSVSQTITVAGPGTASGSPTPVPSGSVAQAQGEKERIFEVSSDAGGHPGAKIPEFTIDRPRVIVEIMTYHWDYNGHKLGTIALKNVDTGETYGPWETVGGTGQGGVENAYWLAHPNVEIPAGTYKLVDSSPSTWFTNGEMKGFGGCYVDALK